jgi:hypothetical protein
VPSGTGAEKERIIKTERRRPAHPTYLMCLKIRVILYFKIHVDVCVIEGIEFYILYIGSDLVL